MSSSRASSGRVLLGAGAVAGLLAIAFLIDRDVAGWARGGGRPDWLREIARGVSVLGTGRALLPLLALVLARGWVLADRRTMEVAGRVTVALLLAAVASPVLKLLFSRERPNADDAGVFHPFGFLEADASFPSGHSMAAFALAGALAASVPRWRLPIYAAAALVPLARVVGGRHFVSDAVAGMVIGWLLAAAAPRVIARWRARRAAEE